MARAMVSRAEADGRLKPGYTVIEYTGGSTGTSLGAGLCGQGISDSHRHVRSVLAREAAITWRRWAHQLTLVPSEGGLTTKKLILDMIEAVRTLSRERNTYLDGSVE